VTYCCSKIDLPVPWNLESRPTALKITLLVLLETAILTNFARVGLTPILADLWGDQVATTEEALEEYAAIVRSRIYVEVAA